MVVSKEVQEQFIKLEIMGFFFYRVHTRLDDKMLAIHKNHKQKFEEICINTSHGSHRKDSFASYIFCNHKQDWIKMRMSIPDLTHTERVLYGK